MTSLGFSISGHGDPEAEIAASALSRMVRERQLDRYRRWLETRTTYPREWREAAIDAQDGLYLTAGELEQLGAELMFLLRSRFPERMTDPSKRPPGSVPVEMLVLSYPLSPPAEGPRSGS